MTVRMRWEEPPKKLTKIGEFVAVLRSNPGRWARFDEWGYATKTTAYQMAKKYNGVRFEMRPCDTLPSAGYGPEFRSDFALYGMAVE